MNTSSESPARTETPFRGRPSRSQFGQVQRMLLPWWAKSYMFAAYMTCLMITTGVGWSVTFSSPARAIPDLLYVGLALILLWLANLYFYTRAWKMQTTLHGEISGTVSEQGIEWNTVTTSSKFPWEKILKYKQVPDMTLAFYSPRCAFYFPRDFFASNEDWRQFNDTVATHVSAQRPIRQA